MATLARVRDGEDVAVTLYRSVHGPVLDIDAEAGIAHAKKRAWDGRELETRNWPESWVADTSQPGTGIAPPVAVELRLRLEDLGEVRRLYVLPPL